MKAFKKILSVLGIKNCLSVLLTELPYYLTLLYRPRTGWIYLRNRNDKTVPAIEGSGLSLLDDYTSLLRAPRFFPFVGKMLYKNRLNDFSFRPLNHRKSVIKPCVSIIIGHRGKEKQSHLQLTLQSIAAQSFLSLECIIVEQDISPKLNLDLPDWINYYFDQVSANSLYNRSAAFNTGARLAQGEIVVLHDNDLLIPEDYITAHLSRINQGYDLVNLKRFIFGLDAINTDHLFETNELKANSTPEYIMQNAKGGGSLVITKQAYKKIGGFDQRFAGWGGEDNEFWQRAQLLNIYPFANLALIHLWHPPQQDKRKGKHGGGKFTEQLISELSAISVRKRVAFLQEQVKC